jgi:hypothetical protein
MQLISATSFNSILLLSKREKVLHKVLHILWQVLLTGDTTTSLTVSLLNSKPRMQLEYGMPALALSMKKNAIKNKDKTFTNLDINNIT